jgi:hypothetical protein
MVDVIDRTGSDVHAAPEVQTPIMLCCANGHSFTQRYNKVPPEENLVRALRVGDWDDVDETVEVINSLFTEEYVCDICERCGLTVGVK